MSTAPQPSRPQQAEPVAGVSAARWRRSILRHSKLKPTERLVAIALADFMDATGGNCRPSHEGIATRTGLHRNAVGRALRRLEAAGWLEVERPASPNQHSRSTYRPKNPTNIVELQPAEAARTPESRAKGARTPGVHKVEGQAVKPDLPVGQVREIPATDQESGRLRVEDHSSPSTHLTTSKKEVEGLRACDETRERLEWLEALERIPHPRRLRFDGAAALRELAQLATLKREQADWLGGSPLEAAEMVSSVLIGVVPSVNDDDADIPYEKPHLIETGGTHDAD